MNIVEFLKARLDEDEHRARQAWAMSNRPDEARRLRRAEREVEAKRAIVDEHGGRPPYHADPCDAHDATFATIPCETVRALAAIYADHPDYDPDWAI